MKVYEITLDNNSIDKTYTWYLKDTDCTGQQIIQHFKKLIVQEAREIKQVPTLISCKPNDDSSVEIYHGLLQYEDFHVEFSLAAYSEEQFFERIASDENFVMGDEFVLEPNTLGLDDEAYYEYLDQLLQPTA